MPRLCHSVRLLAIHVDGSGRSPPAKAGSVPPAPARAIDTWVIHRRRQCVVGPTPSSPCRPPAWQSRWTWPSRSARSLGFAWAARSRLPSWCRIWNSSLVLSFPFPICHPVAAALVSEHRRRDPTRGLPGRAEPGQGSSEPLFRARNARARQEPARVGRPAAVSRPEQPRQPHSADLAEGPGRRNAHRLVFIPHRLHQRRPRRVRRDPAQHLCRVAAQNGVLGGQGERSEPALPSLPDTPESAWPYAGGGSLRASASALTRVRMAAGVSERRQTGGCGGRVLAGPEPAVALYLFRMRAQECQASGPLRLRGAVSLQIRKAPFPAQCAGPSRRPTGP